MSKIKESLPEHVYNGTMSLEHYALKKEVEELIEQGIFEDKSLLKEFLEEIIPIKGDDYFIYIEDDTGNYANIRYDREKYIHALCCLSQHQLTLYYHLASFKDGWITNDNAKSVRCLYVDIDDIGMRADKTSKKEAVRFLKDNFNLSDVELPRWCILSGNGMHLCFPISEITSEHEKLRELYTASLVTHFKGDCSGVAISHQFRCAESYSMKELPIKGKLFRLNDSDNTNIHRLDWCLKTEEEIYEYRRSYYARRTEKSKATSKKNKELEKEFFEKLGNTSLEEYLAKPCISAEERKIANKLLKIQLKKKALMKEEQMLAEFENRILNYTEEDFDLYIYSENSLPYLHLRTYDGYKAQNRTMNLILDLHHFFIRHKGCLVSRNVFFYIVASLFRLKKMPVSDCLHWCNKYVDSSFRNEMYQIVTLTYKCKTKHHISNKQIADMLCFTEEDIAESFCNFSDERVQNARKIRNRNHYEKNVHKAGKLTNEERKKRNLDYLKEHPDASFEEANKQLGIGRTTYFNLKKEIKIAADS